MSYFGYFSKAERDKLQKDTFIFPNQHSIPFSRVLNCLKSLEDRGFGKHQIREATPLLFYPHSLVEKKLDEMEHMEEFAGNWSEEKKKKEVLNICLYLIEKEAHFSSDFVWMGTKPELSNEFYQELKEKLGYVSPLWKRAKENESQSKLSMHNHSVTKTFTTPMISARNFHNDQIRSFSTSSAHEKESKFWGLNVINPFKAIKIREEFKMLQREWDPSIEKDSFLEASKQARD